MVRPLRQTLCGRVVEEIEELYIVTRRLKAGILETEETSIARQLFRKHVSATTPNNGIIVDRWNYIWVRPEAIKQESHTLGESRI
jgi:hypothetical protein